MRRFATDYLQAYPGEEDWVCVYDLCCGYDTLLFHGFDVSAWWSPSRAIVAFGNGWHDVPDMPFAAPEPPSERQVLGWVEEHPGWLWRKRGAALGRKRKWEEKSAETQAFYDRHGGGTVYAEFRDPSGGTRVVEHACGIHGPLHMLPLAIGWMRENMPGGTVLKKLSVTRRNPVHRGELRDKSKSKRNHG